MECRLISHSKNWNDIINACNITQRKDIVTNDYIVSDKFKNDLINAEHSPIRLLYFAWVWYDIPYYSSVHLTRHKIGIEHFVSSQRRVLNRGELQQNEPVNHLCYANYQAILNISRRRLCYKADSTTREIWRLFLETIVKPNDLILYNNCIPMCRYRNGCPELETCGYFKN